MNVILDPASRRDPEGVGGLLLRGLDNRRVPLREVADVFETMGRALVLHEGGQRSQAVSCNVTGRDVTGFVAEARRRIRSEGALWPYRTAPQSFATDFPVAA